MIGYERWSAAQTYEKAYWEGIARQIAADSEKQLTWYAWKAGEFERKLSASGCVVDRDKSRILEVGSGPVGIVSYLTWGERYALDPLSEFYSRNAELAAQRSSGVSYLSGGGEQIAFPDRTFDIVIIDNVLDHVWAPGKVVEEIRRVLTPQGVLYLELNIHTDWGRLLHSMLAKLRIDKGHPHSFTAERIREFLNQHGFLVAWETVNDYFEARQADRRAPGLKSRVKGYSGLSEFIYSAVCAIDSRSGSAA
jgi:ubiquinone/menaquinone biosynthesis C-methylase UbiE